ncbi:MAG: hypothetical protein Q7S56_01060 [Nanoarchaeota archaeon]|nr:hypothetical protein [Nanoarchaeota archaeon]
MNFVKRGSILYGPLVGIILLILSLSILLFFYYQLNWSGSVDTQTCHTSVVLRATAPETIQGYVPLKCKTQKDCIGGDCLSFKGADSVNNIKTTNTDQIAQTISKDVVECWKMMGEGKVSLFSQKLAKDYGLGSVYPTCIICSRVAFNTAELEKAGIKKEDLNNVNVLNYMLTHKAPGQEISYYEYLTGSSPIRVQLPSNLNTITKEQSVEFTGDKGTETFNVIKENVNIQTAPLDKTGDSSQELAIVFMQISAPESVWKVYQNDLNALSIATLGSLFIAPVKTVGVLGSLITSPVTWVTVVIGGAYQAGGVYYNQAVASGYCGDLTYGGTERNGCSAVRTINYNVEELKKYCGVIESID